MKAVPSFLDSWFECYVIYSPREWLYLSGIEIRGLVPVIGTVEFRIILLSNYESINGLRERNGPPESSGYTKMTTQQQLNAVLYLM